MRVGRRDQLDHGDQVVDESGAVVLVRWFSSSVVNGGMANEIDRCIYRGRRQVKTSQWDRGGGESQDQYMYRKRAFT